MSPATAKAGPFKSQGGVRYCPTSPRSSDDCFVRHPSFVEKDLVEEGMSGHLPQRPNFNPRLFHVNGKVGDSLVFGSVHVSTSKQHALLSQVAARGPYLLTGDNPLVAISNGPRLQSGKVGTGTRFRKQLAPRDSSVEDLRNIPADLLGGAVHSDGRSGQHQTQTSRWTDHIRVGKTDRHRRSQVSAIPTTTGFDRQRWRSPPSLFEPLPPLGDRQLGIPVLL